MTPFAWAKPGVKVICIRDRPWKNRHGKLPPSSLIFPKFMQQYTTKEARPMRDGKPGLNFVEFTNPPAYTGREPIFAAKCFRPLEPLTEHMSMDEKETA